MKEIPQEDLKEIELRILKYIDKICKDNEIHYSLAYGTLLGAIRHKGFIPWDDDIDICMDRKNFNKFVKACKHDNNNDYELLWLDTNTKYTLPLPKVIDKKTVLTQNTQKERMPLGVYVDVFVFDKIPNDNSKRNRYLRTLELLQRCWGYSQNKNFLKDRTIKSYVRFLVYSIFQLVNPRIFSILLNKYAQKYNKMNNNEEWGSMVYSINRNKSCVSRQFFKNYLRIPFEDMQCLASVNYEEMLTLFYGNYMEYPPLEKRVSNHDFYAYYLEK